MVRGSEQHDLILERLPRLMVLEDRCAHGFRLTLLVFARGQDRAHSPTLIGPQSLTVALGGISDHGIGQFENGPSGPIVPFQRDGRGAGELFGKVQNVADRSRPKRVDRLSIVADNRDSGVHRSERPKDIGLHDAGVLVLVDEHVVEHRSKDGADVWIPGRGSPEEQKVIEVQ